MDFFLAIDIPKEFATTDFLTLDFWKQRLLPIASFLVILALTFVAARIAKVLFNRFIKRSAESNISVTQFQFFRHIIIAAIYIIGIALAIYAIPSLRTLSVSIFAGAGIIAAILGFASQQAFSNVVSGVFIVLFKPYRLNDRIEVGSLYTGTVEDITLRHTVIRNFQNKRVVIPNSVISSETIVNSTIIDQRVCEFIEIGISYDSDIDKAIRIMQEVSMKHPNCIDNRNEEQKEAKKPVVDVKVLGFGDSSVNLRAYVWAEDWLSGFNMRCDLNKAIKEQFDKEGVEIPFPYRTLVFKRDSAGPADLK